MARQSMRTDQRIAVTSVPRSMRTMFNPAARVRGRCSSAVLRCLPQPDRASPRGSETQPRLLPVRVTQIPLKKPSGQNPGFAHTECKTPASRPRSRGFARYGVNVFLSSASLEAGVLRVTEAGLSHTAYKPGFCTVPQAGHLNCGEAGLLRTVISRAPRAPRATSVEEAGVLHC